MRAVWNAEYLDKTDKNFKQFKQGKVIIKNYERVRVIEAFIYFLKRRL